MGFGVRTTGAMNSPRTHRDMPLYQVVLVDNLENRTIFQVQRVCRVKTGRIQQRGLLVRCTLPPASLPPPRAGYLPPPSALTNTPERDSSRPRRPRLRPRFRLPQRPRLTRGLPAAEASPLRNRLPPTLPRGSGKQLALRRSCGRELSLHGSRHLQSGPSATGVHRRHQNQLRRAGRPDSAARSLSTDLVRGGFQPRLPTSLPPPGQQQPSPLSRRQPVPLMPPAQLHPGAPQVVAPAPVVPLQSPPPSELMDVDPSAGPPSQAVAVHSVLQPLSLGTPKESDTAAPCPAPTQQPSTQRQETLPLFVGPDAPSRPVPEAAPVVTGVRPDLGFQSVFPEAPRSQCWGTDRGLPPTTVSAPRHLSLLLPLSLLLVLPVRSLMHTKVQ
ncbi:uncharacterized protein LOC126234213 [Schistocerca nitens]|uniref:uncharacterized protein LOC126234213 n=1 Tax=Schistocerca nitens TaxID=7011 RepID=UPI0021199844|nr:uncharacterized protein LOC126234213 [Schistocerca nitens]